MRKHCICKLLAVVLVAACAFLPQLAQADSASDPKPIAVGSFCGYDGLFENISTLGKVSGNPDLATGLEAMLKFATRSHGLDGLDKSKPWGAAAYLTGKEPSGYVFLPVTDLAKLLEVLEPFVGKPQDVGDGVLKLSGNEENKKAGKDDPLFIKQQGAWAIISKKIECLALACDDPGKLLGDLPEKYDLAVRVEAADIPAPLREMAIAKIKADAAKDMPQRDGEDDIEYSVRKRVTEELLSAITGAINDISQITVGWTLDNKTEKTYADVVVLAKPGSDAAKQLARLNNAKTRFAGFRMAEAALAANFAGELSQGEADTLKTVLKGVYGKALADLEKEGKPENERKAAAALLGDIYKAFNKAVDAKRIDSAAALLLASDSATLLSAKYVSNAQELEKIADTISTIIMAEHPELKSLVTIKPNAEEYKGVRLHTVSVKIPDDADDREKVVALVGETLEVVLGVGDESIYMAAGRKPLATLKKAIAASLKDLDCKVPPLQLTIGLRSVAGFLAEAADTEEERTKMATLAKILSNAGDKDHLTLTAAPVENGVRLRLEVEEGIVKAIGKMSKMLPSDVSGILGNGLLIQ